MKTSLRALIVEDSEFDAQMMVSMLRKGGYDVATERVETESGLKAALEKASWDIILADYNLPEFNALGALQVLQKSGLDLPFIIVSGGIGEDIAVEAMKAGAHDYLMKGNLNRLLPAVEGEQREATNRAGQPGGKGGGARVAPEPGAIPRRARNPAAPFSQDRSRLARLRYCRRFLSGGSHGRGLFRLSADVARTSRHHCGRRHRPRGRPGVVDGGN